MNKGTKLISFSFSVPIPAISKEKGRLFVGNAGELLVCARARIAAALAEQGIPLAFADLKEDEIKITIETVHYTGVDILPVLNLPEAKALLQSIDKAAHSNLLSIYNYDK
jgi:hypothetical protein